LKQNSVVLALHPKRIPYDEWHVVAMRFDAKYGYIELDGDSVIGGIAEIDSDFYVHFGLAAFAPATVYLDDVEFGP
jgi:hypothetical protein